MPFPFMAAAVLGSGALGFLGQKSANKAASAQALRQMNFQERLSDTAHQREVKDLRAAGLNPILSGTGGRGASTPGGAQAQQLSELGAGVSSALGASQAFQNVKLTSAQVGNINADTALKTAELPRSQTYSDIWTELQGVGRELLQVTTARGRSILAKKIKFLFKDAKLKLPKDEFRELVKKYSQSGANQGNNIGKINVNPEY